MFKKWFFSFVSGVLVLLPVFVLAADEISETADFSNPLKVTSIPTLVGTVIQKGLMGIVGSIGLLMMIVGGLMWLTAAGNAERIETAKKILLWSILGMAVIIGSYTVVSAIFQILPGA